MRTIKKDDKGRLLVTVCLPWFAEDDYNDLKNNDEPRLLPYEAYREKFRAVLEQAKEATNIEIIVVTITARELRAWAQISGEKVSPHLAAALATSAAAGNKMVRAPLERINGKKTIIH